MSTDHPLAIEMHMTDGVAERPRAVGRLRLCACDDGWSLLGTRGEVLFHGLGVGGRRACLEHARRRGTLAVLS